MKVIGHDCAEQFTAKGKDEDIDKGPIRRNNFPKAYQPYDRSNSYTVRECNGECIRKHIFSRLYKRDQGQSGGQRWPSSMITPSSSPSSSVALAPAGDRPVDALNDCVPLSEGMISLY